MTLDAVGLEVMGHAFAAIAEEMGLVLIHSAPSPNIRERRDCSAALFDADGAMTAQAAHIPVHLGAMAESVAAVRGLASPPRPGDVFILNDPYTGGSHLPDITLIGAVDIAGAVGAYSVVRAHHSDVGGMQAGSMPAGAREIFAEGVILPPLLLTPEVERMLLANVRTPETRRGDLAAQRAAVERGGDGLRALGARYGWPAVREAARDLMDYAERRTRQALGRIPAAGLTATDWLEGDGVDDRDVPITVRIDIQGGELHADFTGTAPAVRGNINCPLAVARSAALFVVRALLPEDVPTNGGVGRAVRVTAPEGCLVNARHPSAVAAGNVETSQRIVDTLFLALARGSVPVPAQGQGTMNNVTFGGQLAAGNGQRGGGVTGGWTYYETIGGGQGATLNGERLPLLRALDPSNAVVATGFPFRNKKLLPRYLSVMEGSLARFEDLRRAGAAALDLAWTAAGTFDGFFELGLNTWDVAAGAALVVEVGGRVTDWSGGDTWAETGNILAASAEVHEALLELARDSPQR